MLELTFAEIDVSCCGYLYKEHENIKSNGVLNLEISSPPFKKTCSEIFKFENRILKMKLKKDININLWLYMFTHL